MRRKEKNWLFAAAAFVLVGCLFFCGAMTMLKWDFAKLSTEKFETVEYEIAEAYEHISIETNTADVLLVPSEDGKTAVICNEQERLKHTVSAENGTLVVKLADTRKWYDNIGIHLGTPNITVFLPQGTYGALSVQTDTGKVEIPKEISFGSIAISGDTGDVANYASASGIISIKTDTGRILTENVSAEALELSVSTGNIRLSNVLCTGDVKIDVSTGRTVAADVSCRNLISDGNTGDISLENVIAAEKFWIMRSTGDVKLTQCDADEIFVQTDTGNVGGSLLTDKVFLTQTDTGRITVPGTITGGRCEIITSTGDVDFLP